jgi:1-acyl-sn-glycerol-3-phosphate acyltransferase
VSTHVASARVPARPVETRVAWLVAYWALKAVLAPIMRACWWVRVEGHEHVPRRGPAILAANHRSFIDSFFIPLVVRPRVTFVAKREYFESWRTRWFFLAAGQIPMSREGGSASERALAAARAVLERGGIVGIYPEGTRSPDGKLHRGHTGVARLAFETGAPVVPVGLVGTDAVQPIGARLPRPFRRVTVRFGRPLVPSLAHTQGSPSHEALRGFTDQVMASIAQLCGQDYVDRYARRGKDGWWWASSTTPSDTA